MNISHPELQHLFDTILPNDIQECITTFLSEMEPDIKYDCKRLWVSDQLIGGIGGYCMPANPVKNPFPGGPKRELYRPLQYARSDIEISDVRFHARYVIQMSGMHLEAVCRLYLKLKKPLGSARFRNTTLGKAVHQIQAMKDIDSFTIDGLYDYVKIYNRSKHEVNHDNSKARLFNAFDAVAGYFAARILGLRILKALDISESYEFYEIKS